jgi:hypothetical protein
MLVFNDTAPCTATVRIPTVKYTYGPVMHSEHKRVINILGLALLGFVLKQFESRAQYKSISLLYQI